VKDVVSEVAKYQRSFILISEEVIFDEAFEIASKTGSRRGECMKQLQIIFGCKVFILIRPTMTIMRVFL